MKLKKTLVMVLAACLTIGTLAGVASADVYEGLWTGDFTTEGLVPSPADVDPYSIPSPKNEIPNIIGEVYLVSEDGTEFSGVLTDLPTKVTGWKVYNDNWAYYRDGKIQYHWQLIDGKWYYFNDYGIMIQNGVAWIENRLYYFGEDGVCDTTPGWKLVDEYFYVWEVAGKLTLVRPEAGYAWFYLNQNGYIQTGWNYIDGTWHMCDKYTGRMLCNEWYKGEGGYWYYFDEFTDMATGWMTVADRFATNKTYFFNNNGVLQWGWLYNGGNWYYLNPDDASRVENKWAQIGDDENGRFWYLFDEDGVMQTGWQAVLYKKAVKDDKGKEIEPAVYKWYHLNSAGAMDQGANFVNGSWYLFDEETGELLARWNGVAWQYEGEFDLNYNATSFLTPGEGSTAEMQNSSIYTNK